jgi:hypothetical protein
MARESNGEIHIDAIGGCGHSIGRSGPAVSAGECRLERSLERDTLIRSDEAATSAATACSALSNKHYSLKGLAMFSSSTRWLGKGLDVDFYRSAYPELSDLTKIQACLHYLMLGRAERRFPNSRALEEAAEGLEVDFYRSAYPELSELTDVQARLHYLVYGRTEGRFANQKALEEAAEGLDVDFYRSAYPELSELTDIQARLHYLVYRRTEGRFAKCEPTEDRSAQKSGEPTTHR